LRIWLILFAVTLAAAGQARQGGQARGDRTHQFLGLGRVPDPAAAARGEKLYAPNCSFCHGAKATGAEGPNLIRSAVVLHDDHGELIGQVVSNGRPEKGMPAFPNLTKEQIADIAEFLHMRVELVANRGTYKRLDIVTGDPKEGEAYFNGAGRCNTCHSVSGDLAHIATKFPQPDQLQARFLYPSGVPRRATVILDSGASVSGEIKSIDDFHISIVDDAGDYHSWSRDDVKKIDIADPLAPHVELAAHYTDKEMHNLTAYLMTLK
jgi:mono/diheme cytochrome c family protein